MKEKYSLSEVEKVKITDTVVEDLGDKGLKFIWKRDGIWKEMEMSKIKSHVKKSLRDCKKTEKKRAGDCIEKEVETGKRKAESVLEDGENSKLGGTKIMKKGYATQLNPARQGEINEDGTC